MVKPYLEQVCSQAREAKLRAQDFTQLKRSVLKLGVMCTIAPTRLLDLIRSMRVRHPGVELQIVDATLPELWEKLLGGELEVAIRCQPDPEPDERLHRQPLYRERFVIALHPMRPLAGRDAIRVADLDGEHYLERVHCEFGDAAARIFEAQGCATPPSIAASATTGFSRWRRRASATPSCRSSAPTTPRWSSAR